MNTSHADKNTLDIVMQRAGGAVGLAKRINALGRKIRYQSIQGWIKRGYIPPKSFEVVEMAVGGEVTTQMMLVDFLRKKQGANLETPNGTEAPEAASCPAHLEGDRTGSAAFTPASALTEAKYQQATHSTDTGVCSSASIPVANEQQATIGR